VATPCYISEIHRLRNGSAAPRDDSQYRSSGSALKDQWDHRRVNQFGGDFYACEGRAARRTELHRPPLW
jgi:hypothetical protein